ncbi:hypothetical protein [Streptomyces sp. NBC_01264]|uniref:hypothetical protein n=1 Tax=Streptomyces sp. NBC_01264 TaxID=2903804 RepID=UPI002250C21C|nr:hypothetical protein [Streptomyces sp. NBC_01264]MCX4776645.1 hypothetical protein [Streptomyces sp. NBC_01264]
MITARAASGAQRARRPAGALRLLWLAALLFAFLSTHVARGAVPVAHLDAVGLDGAAGPHGDGTPGGHGDDGGHGDGSGSGPGDDRGRGHPAEVCVSGHPQQGAELPAPSPVPLGDLSPAVGAMRTALWERTAPSGLPPLRSVLGSVVHRV